MNVPAIKHSRRHVLAMVNVSMMMARQYVHATRRHRGRVSTVRAMLNLHVLVTVCVYRMRHVTATIGRRHRINIGWVHRVKNARTIGTVKSVICAATLMGITQTPKHKMV